MEEFSNHEKQPQDCQSNNVLSNLMFRDIGYSMYDKTNTQKLESVAEAKLILNDHKELRYDLPGIPKATFLVVFSPDGTRLASSHGNHNIYISDIASRKHIKTLVGHPRTPWCIAFDPSSSDTLASGCLGGQVRVWHLSSDMVVHWNTDSLIPIASLAFHPTKRLLAIATYNQIYFWDWNDPEPFAVTSTRSDKEKVRYVAFDSLGTKLITGIANSSEVQLLWERRRTTCRYPCYGQDVMHAMPKLRNPFTIGTCSMDIPIRRPLQKLNRAIKVTSIAKDLMNLFGNLLDTSLCSYYLMRRSFTNVASCFVRIQETRFGCNRGLFEDVLSIFRRQYDSEVGREIKYRIVDSDPIPTTEQLNNANEYQIFLRSTEKRIILCCRDIVSCFETLVKRYTEIAKSRSFNNQLGELSVYQATDGVSDSENELDSRIRQVEFNTYWYIMENALNSLYWQALRIGLYEGTQNPNRYGITIDHSFRTLITVLRLDCGANDIAYAIHREYIELINHTMLDEDDTCFRVVRDILNATLENNACCQTSLRVLQSGIRDSGARFQLQSASAEHVNWINHLSAIKKHIAFNSAKLLKLRNKFMENSPHRGSVSSLNSPRSNTDSDNSTETERNDLQSCRNDSSNSYNSPEASTDSANASVAEQLGRNSEVAKAPWHKLHYQYQSLHEVRKGQSDNTNEDSQTEKGLEEKENTCEKENQPSTSSGILHIENDTHDTNDDINEDDCNETSYLQPVDAYIDSLTSLTECESILDEIRQYSVSEVLSILCHVCRSYDSDSSVSSPDASTKNADSVTNNSNLANDKNADCNGSNFKATSHTSEGSNGAKESKSDGHRRANLLQRRIRSKCIQYLKLKLEFLLQQTLTVFNQTNKESREVRFAEITRLGVRKVLNDMANGLNEFFEILQGKSEPRNVLPHGGWQKLYELIQIGMDVADLLLVLECDNRATRNTENHQPGRSTSDFDRNEFPSLMIGETIDAKPLFSLGNRRRRLLSTLVRRLYIGDISAVFPFSREVEIIASRIQDISLRLALLLHLFCDMIPSFRRVDERRRNIYMDAYRNFCGRTGQIDSWPDMRSGTTTGSEYSDDPNTVRSYRIQVWDFTSDKIPTIQDPDMNVVVHECKIHNDASVDISADGKLLVTLFQSSQNNTYTTLDIYSLEWETLGQKMYSTTIQQAVVSVSMSPTQKHILVGLAAVQVYPSWLDPNPHSIAHIYRLVDTCDELEWLDDPDMILVRQLVHTVPCSQVPATFGSLNCIRWAPHPGQGMVYATSTGQLAVLC